MRKVSKPAASCPAVCLEASQSLAKDGLGSLKRQELSHVLATVLITMQSKDYEASKAERETQRMNSGDPRSRRNN